MRIDEHSRIEEPPGIKRAFNRSQSRGKEFRTFLVIPPTMVTPNGVMLRNHPPAAGDNGVSHETVRRTVFFGSVS